MALKVLSPELAEKAFKELNEDPETRIDKIEELRERLNTRPDLPFMTSDKFLIRFLRSRKFDIEKAFEVIVNYYESKRDNKDLFGDFKPSAERKVFESGFNFAFPARDDQVWYMCIIKATRPISCMKDMDII